MSDDEILDAVEVAAIAARVEARAVYYILPARPASSSSATGATTTEQQDPVLRALMTARRIEQRNQQLQQWYELEIAMFRPPKRYRIRGKTTPPKRRSPPRSS